MVKRTISRQTILLPVLLLVLLGMVSLIQVAPAASAPEALGDWEGTPPGVHLSTTTGRAIAPAIAYSADGSTLAVVYLQHTGSFYTPYVRISTNDGVSWNGPTRVVPGSTVNGTAVDVAVDANNRVHIVWLENAGLGQLTRLYYANNVSGSWSAPQTLSQATSAVSAAMVSPRIVASSNNRLDVVWSQVFPDTQFQLNILHKRSANGGGSWSTNPNPVAITGPNSFNPSLAITTDGKLHVVWEEAIIEPPNNEFSRIRYARGTVTGTNTTSSWEYNAANPINIADPSIDEAARPDIVAQGNTLFVAYSYRYGGAQPGEPVWQEVYVTSCSSNCTNAASWVSHPSNPISGSAPVGVNTQDPFFIIPSMISYGTCVAVYYHGLDGDPNHSLEVVWGSNSCGGWGSNLDRATDFNTRTLYPRLTTDGQWFQLVFELRNPANGDIQIYYRRRELPQPGVFLPFIRRS
ncbi:MAG: glycoside hydrolase [Anaerolineae bacterium]|nr:glycoside hydrolase [Anaerolineae bacterium]